MRKFLPFAPLLVLVAGCATAPGGPRVGVIVGAVLAGIAVGVAVADDSDDASPAAQQQCGIVVGGDGRGGRTSTQVCR